MAMYGASHTSNARYLICQRESKHAPQEDMDVGFCAMVRPLEQHER